MSRWRYTSACSLTRNLCSCLLGTRLTFYIKRWFHDLKRKVPRLEHTSLSCSLICGNGAEAREAPDLPGAAQLRAVTGQQTQVLCLPAQGHSTLWAAGALARWIGAPTHRRGRPARLCPVLHTELAASSPAGSLLTGTGLKSSLASGFYKEPSRIPGSRREPAGRGSSMLRVMDFIES